MDQKEGLARISVYGNELRTTSPAEGYNRALNDYCQKKGSFIWFCVSIRNQEFMKNREFSSYKDSGRLVGSHQKKEDKVENSLLNIVDFCFLNNLFIVRFRNETTKFVRTGN